MNSLQFMNDPDVTPEDAVKVINALAKSGAAKQILQEAAAALLGAAPLYKSAVAVSIVDTAGQGTAETTLASVTIPAATLGPNDGLLMEILWSCTNSAAAKRIRGRFGGTVLWNLDLTTHLTYRQNVILLNRGTVASQVIQANNVTIFSPIGSGGVQTATVDFSVAQVLTITGQFPVAGSGANTLAVEAAVIRKL